ncbi:MAG: maleylacetoacetate isomerase [Pseudogulbenkiania sp.]|nr:maleylacetoacetate isomerase [Pseudogulbenkiania sp.]
MRFYTFFRSSASFRVRIALNLKGLPYEAIPVHLSRDGGRQRSAEYLAVNPEGLVPTLEIDGHALSQSLAIIEYLDERYPAIPLLPADPLERAQVRSFAQAIACDIHPLNNLRVLNYLKNELEIDEERKNAWYRHWVETGLAALERRLGREAEPGRFCFGDTPTLADCCLVPQIFNAQRFQCDLSAMPRLLAVHAACMELEAFRKAEPGAQPDAE